MTEDDRGAAGPQVGRFEVPDSLASPGRDRPHIDTGATPAAAVINSSRWPAASATSALLRTTTGVAPPDQATAR